MSLDYPYRRSQKSSKCAYSLENKGLLCFPRHTWEHTRDTHEDIQMALQRKLKHIDERPNGVLRFRRRFPKDVAEFLKQPTLQIHIRNTSGIAFHQEYHAIMREFDSIVSKARVVMSEKDTRSPIERWHEALLQQEGLMAGVSGLEDDPTYARWVVAQGLRESPDTDPLLVKAVLNPDSSPPDATLEDAVNLYIRDKGVEESRKRAADFARICRRLQEALGPLDQLPIKSLRREHGRRFMDTLLNTKKADGTPLSIASAKREAVIVTATMNHALREFDIDGVSNPFAALPWPKQDILAVEKKLPLEDALVVAVADRLSKDHKPLWSVLAGTGMRLGEAVGLLREDVVLDAPVPHVVIQPNSIRPIKTTSSQRTVPLVGEALRAAKEACNGVQQTKESFPVTPALAALMQPRQPQ
jgi:site-specific recombinase XerC